MTNMEMLILFIAACSVSIIVIAAYIVSKIENIQRNLDFLERKLIRHPLEEDYLGVVPLDLSLDLPEYLLKEDEKAIRFAVKNELPILVSGSQEPTGKTTLVKMLRNQGVTAYEPWECVEIDLNKPLRQE